MLRGPDLSGGLVGEIERTHDQIVVTELDA
jgi:hypothetical protein